MTRPNFVALRPRVPAGRASRPAFVSPRGESAVAALVTFVVCAWFLVAAGAILADPASPYATRTVHVHEFAPIEVVAGTAARGLEPVAAAPEAHFHITVEARRG
ncbi:MAG TPA: hypothetical protein VEG27_00860 [Usitatibacter sp.]|nr:hypothetical protein [Usitatibacter sp.]